MQTIRESTYKAQRSGTAGPWRTRYCARGHAAEFWRNALNQVSPQWIHRSLRDHTNTKPDPSLTYVRWLKRDSHAGVFLIESGDENAVVKVWIHHGLERCAQRYLGLTPGCRQRRGARLLTNAHLPTATVYAHCYSRICSLQFVEMLTIECVPGPSVLSLMRQQRIPTINQSQVKIPSKPITRTLATQLGELSATLARAKLANRDHKPSNLIMAQSASTTRNALTIIDTQGIRRLHWAPSRRLARMHASLVLEPTGIGSPPSMSDCMRYLNAFVKHACTHNAQTTDDTNILARRTWTEVRRVIENHPDPTPLVLPD